MAKNINNLLFLKLLILSSLSLTAEAETDVVTSIAVSAINIDTKINDSLLINDDFVTNGTVTNRRRSEVDTSGAEIGITVIQDSFYFGFTTLITGQTASDFSSRYVQNHPDLGNIDETISNPETVSLTSYSAYIGTSILDNMRLYGGYTTGKSHAGEEYFLEESGPFVGFQFVNGLGSSSSLTFDVSYSALNSELNLKDFDENDESYHSTGNQDGYTIDAETTGFSYSVTWLRSLDRGRSFYIKFKYVDLDIENGSVAITGANNAIGTASVDGSKEVTSLSLGMGF